MQYTPRFTMVLITGYWLLLSILPIVTHAAGEQSIFCFRKDECETLPYKGTAVLADACKLQEKVFVQADYLYNCYATEPEVSLEVPIQAESKTVRGLGVYIRQLYTYLVGISALVGGIMIIWAGVTWLTSGGNPEHITDAKHKIGNALIGLFLVLGSYVILQTVNPALLVLRVPPIRMVRQSLIEAVQSGLPGCATGSSEELPQGTNQQDCERDCGGADKMAFYAPKEGNPSLHCCGCKNGCLGTRDPLNRVITPINPSTRMVQGTSQTCPNYCNSLPPPAEEYIYGRGNLNDMGTCCICPAERLRTSCSDYADCGGGDRICVGGVCVRRKAGGAECSENRECQSNNCNRAILRDTPPSFCEPPSGQRNMPFGYCTNDDQCDRRCDRTRTWMCT